MNIRNIQFKNIGNQSSLRFDVGYRTFFDIKEAITWDANNYLYLSDFLTPTSSGKIKKGVLDNKEYLVDMSNIVRRFDYLSGIMNVSEIGSDKNILSEGDIIIPKLQPRMGNIFTNSDHKRYIGSSELVEYKCDKCLIHQKFLFYLLTHPKFQESLLYSESGKTHRRVSPNDLLKYKIPFISIDNQHNFIEEINPIESEISQTRNKIKSVTEIINNVFAAYFSLDFPKSDNKQYKLVYHSCFNDIANEELKFDISLKYRRIFRDDVYNTSSFSWKPLGKIVTVKGGKRLPKGEDVMDEDTGYRYIRVEDLDSFGHFNIESIKFISEANHNTIQNYIANTDDLLLTIVGATVGKCGILPKELDGENISENFARLIINDKNAYNSLYILYILMSKIGQYQINEYKGRGSQGKLAIFRIKKIQIPDISSNKQREIIDKIHHQVQEQRIYTKKTIELRKKIDFILDKVIMNATGTGMK